MIEIISATRCDQHSFRSTALGRSLDRMSFDTRLVPQIAFSNQAGLPEVYNARIETESPNDILLFVHDDVWLDDYFLANRLIDGLARFGIIGVAGNNRVTDSHTGWLFSDGTGKWDESNSSGVVAHGPSPFGALTVFKSLDVPSECELLDGVLLAAKRSVLRDYSVRFDTRFRFHFYDLDFCRTSRQKGMSLGTWPIAITHNSGGSFGSPDWCNALGVYRDKWQ